MENGIDHLGEGGLGGLLVSQALGEKEDVVAGPNGGEQGLAMQSNRGCRDSRQQGLGIIIIIILMVIKMERWKGETGGEEREK